MRTNRFFVATVRAATVSRAFAQFSNWQDHQVNTSICYWRQPRAALIRDTIYLDGGNIWWTPGLDSGVLGTPVNDGNVQGYILTYNLSQPFSSESNLTGILVKDDISKAKGGAGNNNVAPNYYDGGMLANNDEFFAYGGITDRRSELYNDPEAEDVLAYQAYQYGAEKGLWQKGFPSAHLGDGVNGFIAFGGAASAPSENKAWYFSGLTSPTNGPIYGNGKIGSTTASNVSDTLVELDMTTQFYEKWSNNTLNGGVEGRASPEVVWVPVGKEGILVALGGVLYPNWAGVGQQSENKEASKKESPKFMQTIDVYDVAGKKWYQQPSKEGGPGARALGCAVVAHASDYSSFNIYYYGGYDGISPMDRFSDTVWVLSLPSFIWTKLNEGKSLHARAGHKCFLPYPDQMMVFGGFTPASGAVPSCLDQGPVVVFNVTSGEWMDSYDPSKYHDYGVPEKVQAVIGGDASGGATATKPVPSGWASNELGDLFGTSYDKKKITKYWPYSPAASTDRPDLPTEKDGGGGGSGLPSWVAPVLGVVLGLIFLTGVIVLFCLWRRRRIFKNRSSDVSSEEAGKRILSWIRGQPTEKTPTVTTSEGTPASPEMGEARTVASTPSEYPAYSRFEMPDTQVAELGDTSPPVELHDTGLSPMEVIQKYSRFGDKRSRAPSNPSHSSFSAGGVDYNSVVSQPSGGSGTPRIDSPALGANLNRNFSHRSGLSLQDDEKISVERSNSAPHGPVTPISPPSAGESPGEDYLSSRNVVSPLRKSVFHEHDEYDKDEEEGDTDSNKKMYS